MPKIETNEREKHQKARSELIEELRQQGIHCERTLAVLERAPRHCFLESALWFHAYKNTPLPISSKQTISQPYMVALMTQTLLEHNHDTSSVLEVGTGSGFQAYVLAQIYDRVLTVERIETLHNRAKDLLRDIDCRNVYCKLDDGQSGWSEYQPYPAIIVTAALSSIPDTLLQQLALGGILLAPVGEADTSQVLTLVLRSHEGFEYQEIESVRFVPVLSGTSQ